jgi:hypothetical protein
MTVRGQTRSAVITASTNAIKSGPGQLLGVLVTPSSGLGIFTVRDSLVFASGTSLAVFSVNVGSGISFGQGFFPLNISFTTGLSVEFSAGAVQTMTLIYE